MPSRSDDVNVCENHQTHSVELKKNDCQSSAVPDSDGQGDSVVGSKEEHLSCLFLPPTAKKRKTDIGGEAQRRETIVGGEAELEGEWKAEQKVESTELTLKDGPRPPLDTAQRASSSHSCSSLSSSPLPSPSSLPPSSLSSFCSSSASTFRSFSGSGVFSSSALASFERILHLLSRVSHLEDPSTQLFGPPIRAAAATAAEDDSASFPVGVSSGPSSCVVATLLAACQATRHPRCLRIVERVLRKKLCFRSIIEKKIPGNFFVGMWARGGAELSLRSFVCQMMQNLCLWFDFASVESKRNDN